MLRFLLLFFVSVVGVYAVDAESSKKTKDSSLEKVLPTSGLVQSIAFNQNKGLLYVANDNGIVDIISFAKQQPIRQITLEKITNFMGELLAPKIFEIDAFNDTVLMVVEGDNGGRNIWLFQNNTLSKLAIKGDLAIKKARFINSDLILIATLGNEIGLYHLPQNHFLYKFHLSSSRFSDFSLNEDRTQAALSDESGVVQILDVKHASIKHQFEEVHKDNIYQIQFAGDKVITAGQDRKVGVIDIKTLQVKTMEQNFLVYAVGLNQKMGAYMADEENTITLFNPNDLSILTTLEGGETVPNTLLFINKNYLLSAGDEMGVYVWNLKGVKQ